MSDKDLKLTPSKHFSTRSGRSVLPLNPPKSPEVQVRPNRSTSGWKLTFSVDGTSPTITETPPACSNNVSPQHPSQQKFLNHLSSSPYFENYYWVHFSNFSWNLLHPQFARNMSLKKVETLNFLHLHPCQPFKTVFLFSSSRGGVLKCLVLSNRQKTWHSNSFYWLLCNCKELFLFDQRRALFFDCNLLNFFAA